MNRREGPSLRMVVRFACAVWAANASAMPGVGRAQTTPPDAAIAEQLYQQGRAQMAAGQYEKACASFADSLRLDAATGTLLNLASCHQSAGKLASAWGEFRAGLAAAERDGRLDRVRFARERLAAIEPRLAHLVLDVAAGARLLVVTLDGAPLGAAAWSVPIPLDAGAHEVVVQTQGPRPQVSRIAVDIRDGERRTLAIPPAPVAGLEAPVVPSSRLDRDATATGGAALASPDRDGNRGRGRRVAGWILAGAGSAAVVVGAVYGLRAFAQWGDRNRECPAERCSDQGVRDGQRAAASANLANWTIGSGVAALGIATAILVVGGRF